MALTRKRLVDWLLENGFEEQPRKASGHRQFTRQGVKVAVPDHGDPHVEPKHVSLLARQLTPLGFDPKRVKKELA
jgi:predicted RNA binding protein YcfA (HicA-like mRNA interferase family)